MVGRTDKICTEQMPVHFYTELSHCRFQKSGKRDKIFLATKFGYVKNGTAIGVNGKAE
jgi:hypothetical protein